MSIYETYSFIDEPKWEEVPEGKIENWNWDSKAKYDTRFKMCFVKEKGIYLKMKTEEKNLRRTCTERDESVWEDSCMEFFFCPLSYREEYINIEMNPNGAYLSQIGKGKGCRPFVKTLTEVEPKLITKVCDEGWELELFVPCDFISEAFGEPFNAEPSEIRGNFYKCGDKTEFEHYGSFAKMTTLPPGFHNPQCFAKIIIKER